MRIAIFYGGYLPGEKYGGPLTSLYNFTELLGDDHELYIICKNHDHKETIPYSGINPGWNVVGKAKVVYLADIEYGKDMFSKILDEIRPDMIYASSIFSAIQTYPLLDLSKEKKIPLLLAPRGELNHNALKVKRIKKKAYLLSLKLLRKLSYVFFQATSEEENQDIIRTLKVNRDRVFLLSNVPMLPVHKESVEKQLGQMKMCFVGRIVENKNLIIALKAVIHTRSNIEFDIYGPIEQNAYWEECQKVIGNAPDHVKIAYKGALAPARMRETYKGYDCLISPTRFENYGQAIVEAMLNDVPVIISKGTTPWDDIAEQGAGYTVSLSDIDGFTKAIDTISFMDGSQYKAQVNRLRSYCEMKFDYSALKKQYEDCFKSLLTIDRD